MTDNVTNIVEIAKQYGATVLEEPKEKPWGKTVGYIRDIDGFLIEIFTPVS